MKKHIIQICFGIILLFSNTINSQNVTIDYSTFSSSACNVFGTPVIVNGASHQTTIGQPQFSSSNQSVKLNSNYNGGIQKGTEYKISYNIKQNYTYTIKVTGRNVSSYSVRSGLKISFGDNGSGNLCNGPDIISGTSTSTLPAAEFINTDFNENIYLFNNPVLTSSNYIRIGTYSEYQASPQLQAIEIKRIEIIEIPPVATFEIFPTTQNLACGDTSSKSFTVTPANIPSGATVTYQWSNSGWSGAVNSSMSTVTLTPNPGTTLPGSVSVTPYINGVAKPTLICAVARSPFNPSYTITGNTQGCPNTSSNYSINSETNSVVWSLSTTGVASLNTTTGQNVILTGIANGSVQLNATVTNACGQTKVFSKAILIGKPVVTNNTITGGGPTAPINTTTQLSAAYVTGATGYLWTVSNLSSNCVTTNGSPLPGVILPKFYNGLNTFTSVSPIAFVNWGNCPADVVVNCSAINACGNTGIGYRVVSVYGSGGGGGGDPCAGRMSITPNPVKEDIISINIADPIDPCGPNSTSTRLAVNNQVKIYDLLGNLLYSGNFNSNNFSITDLKLKKGHYALNVFSAEGYVSKKMIVVE